jgi:hypothetical protein
MVMSELRSWGWVTYHKRRACKQTHCNTTLDGLPDIYQNPSHNAKSGGAKETT